MDAMTISQVSRDYGISTRMLRYYEQIGLIESYRREDYAYRMYEETALIRLRQILILRKLRLPLKQIKLILQKPDAVVAIEVFRQNINELNDEIIALSIIQSILSRFVDELQKSADIQIHSLMTQNGVILNAIESLSLTSINFKEDRTMDKLEEADEGLSKLRDVRIVYLPPATVAAAHYIGDDPEDHVRKVIDGFVRCTGLCNIKPDIRHYGFNHPNPVDEAGYHGYEMWVTIPDDMEVPSPLEKKHFSGGMYAAHMIAMGDFHEWEWLDNWVMKNGKYEHIGDTSENRHMKGCLEESLNYISRVDLDNTEPEELQLDLLMPVRAQ